MMSLYNPTFFKAKNDNWDKNLLNKSAHKAVRSANETHDHFKSTMHIGKEYAYSNNREDTTKS